MQCTPPPPRASVVPGTGDRLAARVEALEQRQRRGVGVAPVTGTISAPFAM